MKKTILAFICLCCFTAAHCQSVIYPQAFSNTLAQAASLHKLVFLTIEPPANARHPDEAAGLTGNTEAKMFYDQHFVSFSVNYDDSIAQPLIKWYGTTSYPAYVIADQEGNLLNKGYVPDITSAFFMQLGQKAIDAQSSGRTIGNYSLRYRLGNRDSASLKEYITIREELGFYDNGGLAEDYVASLHPEDAANYNEVLFILKAGPYAYGKAYQFCWSDKNTADSIYHHEPLALRISINNRISDNTTNYAIEYKRIDIAQSSARYSAATWLKNERQASMAGSARMLNYYWGIRDTASYLSLAKFYYDEYYMTISADSARKTVYNNTSINSNILKAASPINKSNIIPTDSIGPNRVTSVLNTAAYNFYTSGTHNPTYLNKALLWVVQSIDIYPDCHNFDTLAHLLYRLGYFTDAETNELQAIKFAKQANMSGVVIDRYTKELNKITGHQL